MPSKEKIHIVWFKRDLRIQDNEALFHALNSEHRCLLLYIFEPSLIADEHYSERHWNFVKESIRDLNRQLAHVQSQVLAIQGEVIPILRQLQEHFHINKLFSHQETGIRITYDRDLEVQAFCQAQQIEWQECVNNGVFRGRKNRTNWKEDWEYYMSSPLFNISLNAKQLVTLPEIQSLEEQFQFVPLYTPSHTPFQKGGTQLGLRYLQSFFSGRYVHFNKHISKPLLARKSCSRLSPYLAWGNLSIRQVWQAAKKFRKESSHQRALDGFRSRLQWQAHFIQKFEMEDRMEFQSVNRGFLQLVKPINHDFLAAWKTGKTGFPLVDACMRCLVETGYINFRMRALLVSFATHHLWQPWQAIAPHLAQQFLDFEPGIHFPQLQMQAGETGINTLRIYSPIKNSLKHDADGTFIKKWVPELAHLPLPYVHEPYKMTALDQQLHQFTLGEDYPFPIVNLEHSRKYAGDTLWGLKDDPLVKKECLRILQRHVINPSKSR
ncbi:MAG: deoxyribodipyrimidine photo-lyase/cryptochrome family protein [Flammeovirgaceae bacterium]